MVSFARYTELAYEIARQRPWYSRLTGPGSQPVNQAFISDLGEVYRANNHQEATEAQARQFLSDAIAPP